jgi:hypothetical protein
MHDDGELHIWFIFNLHLEVLFILPEYILNIYRYTTILKERTLALQNNPVPASLLVVTNSHPPLSIVCQQLPRPLALAPFTPFSPHSSYYIIYIDNINNLGRLRLGQ